MTPFGVTVTERYERVPSAVVASSVIRGEATATSDLDMVIVLETLDTPYREPFILELVGRGRRRAAAPVLPAAQRHLRRPVHRQ
jgi:hypothetical protein